MIARADGSSADPPESGDSRGEYEVTIHRASTSTTPPAMPALSRVRRVLFGKLPAWDLGSCVMKALNGSGEKRTEYTRLPRETKQPTPTSRSGQWRRGHT